MARVPAFADNGHDVFDGGNDAWWPDTRLWDLVHGCKAGPDCYDDQFDATAGSLKPELNAPLSAAAWLAGRDLAMEAVVKDLRGRSAPHSSPSSHPWGPLE